MVIEIISYKSSILNPLLKLIIFMMFAIGTWYYYRAWKKYGGNLKVIAGALMCGGIAGCIGAGARFLGDFLVEFKWFESTGTIIFALVSVYVAWLVYTKLSEIAEAFGMAGGK
ncbi:MAG: hypothetical protein LUQ71_07745 [Methanoregula sp.]|jgi:hypothetical protein|nr:hypothetical protein [Methanoregula sp.]